jgi:serine/threonine-protein kinase
LQYAVEIADALDKAHRAGVTHRDIKPGNIMLVPSTSPGAGPASGGGSKRETKLLDFGLAKLKQEVAKATIPASERPTIPGGALTQDGTILGTLHYMAPEQLESKEVDGRADIFSFGAVVHEMVTGKKAFPGDTQASIIAKILDHDPPPVSSLEPPGKLSPPALDRIVERCLAKDREDRWQAMRDVCHELQWVKDGGAKQSTAEVAEAKHAAKTWQRAMPWAVALVLSVGIGLAVWTLKPTPPPEPKPVSRVAVNLAPNERLPANLNWPVVALSPDGTQLAYAASRGGTQQIYLRAMDSLEARPLAGTEGGTYPFFSPDGQWLGFLAGGQLQKVPIRGGAALTLAPASNFRGASWGDNDMIVFAPTAGGPLSQVPAAGGAPQPLTKVEAGEVTHRWPQLLPGGKAVLFAAGSTGSGDSAQIVVQNLETGQRKALVQGGTYPRYAPTGPSAALPSTTLPSTALGTGRAGRTGHLVYYRAGTLMAVPFDLERLEVTGSPSPIVEGVMATTANAWGAHFSISERGSLVYVPGAAGGGESTLVWVDRKGAEQPLAAPPHLYNIPRLSPDGRLVAVATLTPTEIWVYDIVRGTLSRLTFEGGEFPLWSPDGKRIAFASARAGKPPNLFWKPADGSGAEERLTTSDHLQAPHSWSPDGQVLAFTDTGPTTGQDIWVLPLEGDPSAALRTGPSAGSGQGRKPRPFLQTTFLESGARFSPDGRWLAYLSDESGRNEIYVQPFPGPGGKWQISREGGTQPLWARNGEIFYRNGNQLMVVETKTQPGSQPIFSAGTPRLLFEGPYVATGTAASNYDVTADGQRFLMVKPSAQEGAAATQINVVLNWFEELKRRVP